MSRIVSESRHSTTKDSLELSISTGSLYPQETRHAIRRIHKLGFRSLELTIQSSDMKYGFERTFDKQFVDDVIRLKQNLELHIPLIHAPYFSPVDVFSDLARAEILNWTLRLGVLLNSEVIILHPYHIFSNYERARLFLEGKLALEESLLTGFDEFMSGARKRVITIALENVAHWKDSHLLNNPTNMLKLVNGLRPSNVKVDFDLYHSELGKCTSTFLHQLKQLIVTAHIADSSPAGSRTLPGKGRLDWTRVFEELRRLPMLRYIVLETGDNPTDRAIKKCVNQLSLIMGSVTNI